MGEIWDTYSPSKHVWSITRIKVQPNKIDDYLAGLQKSYVPAVENEKKDGSLIDYRIMRNFSDSDADIVIIEEYASWEVMAPNKERDLRQRAEFRALLPKEQADKIGDEYNNYRTFLDQDSYYSVEFMK
jgi:hypothetical protein